MIDTHVNVYITELEDAAQVALTSVSRVRAAFQVVATRYEGELKAKETEVVDKAHDAALKAVQDLKDTIDKIRAQYEPEIAAALETDATEAAAETATPSEQGTEKVADKKADKKS